MPEFENEAGERIGALAGSDLERALLKKGWTEVGAGKSKDTPDDDLAGLKRGELNEIAEAEGVEAPAKLKTVSDVRDAIRNARAKD